MLLLLPRIHNIDVAIVGGGAVGAGLARALVRDAQSDGNPLKIALIEPRPPREPRGEFPSAY